MVDGEDQRGADHQPGNKEATSGNKDATSGNKDATFTDRNDATGGAGYNTTEVPQTPARTSTEVTPEFLTSMTMVLDTLLQKSTSQEKMNEELRVIATASKNRGKGNGLFRRPRGRLNPTALAFSTPLKALRTRVFSSPQPSSGTTTLDADAGVHPQPPTMRTSMVINLEDQEGGRNLAADLATTEPTRPGRNPSSG